MFIRIYPSYFFLHLSRHVERCESILRLDIDACGVRHKDLHHLVLPGKAGNVQGGVALLRCRVDLGSPGEQLGHNALVTLLTRQVQCIEAVLAKQANRNQRLLQEEFIC